MTTAWVALAMAVTIGGLALPYNEWTDRVTKDYKIAFEPRAFAQSIQRRTVEAQINHGNVPIASQANGTLSLIDLPDGLFFKVTIEDWIAPTILDFADAGQLWGVSPGWSHPVSYWNPGNLKVIYQAHLKEISIILGSERPAWRSTWARVLQRA